MAFFVLSFFQLDVLDEIGLEVIEPVLRDFLHTLDNVTRNTRIRFYV